MNFLIAGGRKGGRRDIGYGNLDNLFCCRIFEESRKLNVP